MNRLHNGPTCTLSPRSERAADWRGVFGRLEDIPVLKALPVWAGVPGREKTLVYELDLERLTPDERTRLVAHISARFGYPALEVERDLDAVGCPILAEDVIVALYLMGRGM